MRRRKRIKDSEHKNRGVYVIPNLVTSLNMFCGFFGIIMALRGQFTHAAWAVIAAGVFDNLDGKIARATNTTSKFGVEYDSLSDLVSFGMAPALIMYMWALQDFGRLGWLVAFLFLACGALRLARFNTQVGVVSSDHFVGLPIPAGAGMAMVTILLCYNDDLKLLTTAHPAPPYSILILIMMFLLAFLMVSTISYESFKNKELATKKKSLSTFTTALLVIILIVYKPDIMLFIVGVTYVLSGPAVMVWKHVAAPKKAAVPPGAANNKGGETEKPADTPA